MGKKFGDRKDGVRLKKISSMHAIMPLIFPNRCDNEAFISEQIDMTNVLAYLEKKNENNPEYAYNLYQVVVTAVLKAIMLRPKMNRFIKNQVMYQHNEVTAAFTVKKLFSDDGGEALARIRAGENDTIDTVHEELYRQISFCRSDSKDSSTAAMDVIQRLPAFLLKLVGVTVRFLDRHGWMPDSMIATDPFHCSVVLSNLGSIGLHAGYHHLTNWGTCSVFCMVGQMKKRPVYDESGNMEMRPTLDLGLTVDERIADGYYYSRTVRLLRKLLENPELLELPLKEEVDY